MDMVLSIDLSAFPQPLRAILEVIKIKGAIAAPAAFRAAMAWVWDTEQSFVPQYIKDEIVGMGDGICASDKRPNSNCNATEWSETIAELNMLPELIRMACTAYGAWGKATATGSLVQLRALSARRHIISTEILIY